MNIVKRDRPTMELQCPPTLVETQECAMNACTEYFKSVAARLKTMSRSCFDLGTSGELRRVATEVDSKAKEMCHEREGAER